MVLLQQEYCRNRYWITVWVRWRVWAAYTLQAACVSYTVRYFLSTPSSSSTLQSAQLEFCCELQRSLKCIRKGCFGMPALPSGLSYLHKKCEISFLLKPIRETTRKSVNHIDIPITTNVLAQTNAQYLLSHTKKVACSKQTRNVCTLGLLCVEG